MPCARWRAEARTSAAGLRPAAGPHPRGELEPRGRSPLESLSPASWQVLRLVAEGQDQQGISRLCWISACKPCAATQDLMKKLGVNNVAGLTTCASCRNHPLGQAGCQPRGVMAPNSESFGTPLALLFIMRLRLLRSPIRHPFYPGLAVTLAVECKGPCAGLSGTLRDLTSRATCRRARPV